LLQPSMNSPRKVNSCMEIPSRIGVLPDLWDTVSEEPINPCTSHVLSQIGNLPHDWDRQSAQPRLKLTHAGIVDLTRGMQGKSRTHSAHGPTADNVGKVLSRAQRSIFTEALEPHITSIATWLHCDDSVVSPLSTIPNPWG